MGLLQDIYPSIAIEYAQSYGIIMTLEAKLLSHEKKERLLSAKNIVDAINALTETPYEEDAQEILAKISNGNYNARDLSQIFTDEINDTFITVGKISPDENLLRLFQIYLDIHNLKLFIKYKFSEIGATLREEHKGVKEGNSESVGISLEDIKPFLYNYRNMKFPADYIMEIKNRPLNELPNYIDDPYLKKIASKAIADIMSYESAHEYYIEAHIVDSMIDKETYIALKEISKKIKVSTPEERKIIEEYINTRIDLINIKLLLRCAMMGGTEGVGHYITEIYVPGGYFDLGLIASMVGKDIRAVVEALKSTPYHNIVDEFSKSMDLSELDAIEDKVLDRIMERSRIFTLCPLNIIHYLYRKEREIETVRGVLIAKAYNLPSERTRKVINIG